MAICKTGAALTVVALVAAGPALVQAAGHEAGMTQRDANGFGKGVLMAMSATSVAAAGTFVPNTIIGPGHFVVAPPVAWIVAASTASTRST